MDQLATSKTGLMLELLKRI